MFFFEIVKWEGWRWEGFVVDAKGEGERFDVGFRVAEKDGERKDGGVGNGIGGFFFFIWRGMRS